MGSHQLILGEVSEAARPAAHWAREKGTRSQLARQKASLDVRLKRQGRATILEQMGSSLGS